MAAINLLEQISDLLQKQKDLLGDGFQAVAMSQFNTALLGIRNASVTLQESGQLCDVISRGPWTDSQKRALGEAVQESLQQTSNKMNLNKAGKRSNQELSNFYGYLSQHEKAVLCGESSLQSRLNLAADVCCRLELLLPSEKSVGHVISTIRTLCNRGLGGADDFLAAVTELKRMLKVHLKRTGIQTYLQKYPDDPRNLPEGLKHKFVEAEGGELAISSVSSGPLRTSNKAVRGGAAALAAPSSANSMLEMMAQLFMQGNQAQTSVALPGLRILRPSESSRAPAALTDNPKVNTTPPAAAVATVTAEADGSAVKDNGADSPSVPPSAAVVALTDTADMQEPALPVSPAEQAAAMMKAWERKDADSKQAEATPGILKSSRGRGKGPGSRGGRGRGADQLQGHPGRGGLGRGGRGGRGRGGRSGSVLKPTKAVLKKPAHKKPVHKKPAASHVPTRAAVRAMSREERIRLRPMGCGKCRWVPGCSPSCYGE